MAKAAVVTPLYISVAWTIMVSYQMFTQTAVTTVTTCIDTVWPSIGGWLFHRIDMLVFIHAFAWVFLLSSAIPSIILGKGKGVLIQFFVCLTLTFTAFIVQDILTTYGGGPIGQIFSLADLFRNPFLAIGYLSMPYLLMLGFDINSRRKQKKKKEKIESVTDAYLEDAAEAEEDMQQEELVETDEEVQEEEWAEEEENIQEEEYAY